MEELTNRIASAATLQDVANLSGVSLSTVSKILSGANNFKDSTINKVKSAAEELNYMPNVMARQIASNSKNRIIGYLIPNLFNSYYSGMASTLESYLYQHDYELTICLFNDDVNRARAYLHFLTEIRASGIIFGSFNEPECLKDIDIARKYMPIVSIQADIENVDRVDVSDYDGTYEIISYLIKKGHKKIGFLGYQYDTLSILSNRLNAYKDALKDNGIPFRSEYVVDYKQTPNSGYIMANRLLNLADPPTAIHCFNEYIVPDVYGAIQDRGLSIPDDVSVTAFDGLRLGSVVRPQLTTIYGPNDAMANTAVDLLLNRIEANYSKKPPQHIIFKHTLMERGSVADITNR
jgi:LacI family transcriptional regulator